MPVSSHRLFQVKANGAGDYQQNFTHLYFDMLWFGTLSGSAMSFLTIYATRLGASGLQIGLLAAVSAMVSLVLSIPAGNWLHRVPIGKAVFWTAVLSRLGYLLWIPLPWLLGNQGQIWALILITLAMGVPLCGFGIGFNSLFASAVPAELRALVVGRRNMIYALAYMASSVGAGYILDHVRFPAGYQIIFGIGFLSASLSTLHLFFIRPIAEQVPDPSPIEVKPVSPVKDDKSHDLRKILHLDIWASPFRTVLLVLMGFHLTQYLAFPLFPLYIVNTIHLTDANIGLATAFFYLTVMLGSTQLNRLVNAAGHQKITAWGLIGMCLYPVAMSVSQNAIHYYLLSIVGGFAWALAGGGFANYMLERIPASERSAHLAWYNIILNGAILVGSLAGPFIATIIGLRTALVVFGALRLLTGLAILKWG